MDGVWYEMQIPENEEMEKLADEYFKDLLKVVKSKTNRLEDLICFIDALRVRCEDFLQLVAEHLLNEKK